MTFVKTKNIIALKVSFYYDYIEILGRVLQPSELCVQTQPFTFLPPLIFPNGQMDLQVVCIKVLTGSWTVHSCLQPFEASA